MFFIGKVAGKLDSIRKKYYANQINESVNNFGGRLSYECKLSYPKNITIGKNTYINGGYIFASKNAEIKIGSNCLISYEVHIRTDGHNFEDKNSLISSQGHTEKNIIIEDDVWIGFGAQILSGVTVRTGSVIGAGSIVTKNTEPYGVYVGIPAKKIKSRR